MQARGVLGTRRRRISAALVSVALVVTSLVLPGVATAADPTALFDIRKTASTTNVVPGETFEYTIEVSCSSITDLGCINAELVDPVPDEFEILGVDVADAAHDTPVIDGQNVSVTFNEDLGGVLGLKDNTTATVTITVKVRDDLPYALNGVSIPNTASVSGDNAEQRPSTAPVIPTIPLTLDTTAEKSFDPAVAQAAPGTETTLTLNGTNTSNAAVDSLTLTDPVNPSAAGNPFDYLAITGVDSVNWPDGAETVVLEYWDGSDWVEAGTATRPGAPNAPPTSATGIKVTFTGPDGADIPVDATGGIVLTLEQRDTVAELDASLTLRNVVESTVALGEDSESGTDDATYRIVTEPITVGAVKEFLPASVFAGGSTSVVLTGSNAGETTLDTLSIREPAVGVLDDRLAFDGFTSAVQFPTGAETAELTFVYLDVDGDEHTVITSDLIHGAALPGLPADFATLQYFEIVFTSTTGGPIVSGADSVISFDAIAAEDLDAGTVIENVVGVGGASGEQTASATDPAELVIDERRIDLATEKKISPATIWGYEGEVATIQLPTTVLPSSTTNARSIVVNDPELDGDGNPVASDWWDHFRPTAITKTDVPTGATLTVRYYDTVTDSWETLIADVPGGQAFSMNIPEALQDRIGGLQFEFINDDPGFAPNATVQPNITTELKESLDAKPVGEDISVENCSSASATAPGSTAGAASVDPCPSIEILAPEPGDYDLIEKEWIAPADGLVTARSGDSATSRLHWSTGGLGGIEQMIIADTATDGSSLDAGPSAAVEDTVYQAFNLTGIKAITPAIDPLIAYDRITAVELWNGTAWVPATNAAVPYNGSLPAITLTTAERESTLGVRLIVEEYTPARVSATDPTAPSVGSGVARSFGNDRRIDLDWVIRDTKRVPGDDSQPVLGSELYNLSNPGDVNNTASATGFTGGDQVGHDADSDIISILDRPLNVSVVKGWSGGPLGVPQAGTDAADYPSGRVTITATNTTVARVDVLEITDPGVDGTTNAFDTFDLKRIVSISVPTGADADDTVVTLVRDGAATTTHTVAGAIALSETDLANVISVQVTHNGRIVTGGASTLVMDLRLRETHRGDGTPVTVVESPVDNQASAAVRDPGGVNGIHEVTATDEAQIQLASLNIGVQTEKSFSPTTQYELYLPEEPIYATEPWDPITMTITAQPSGSARPATLTVTDDTATFWNTYRFVDFADSFSLAAPIQQVRVDALVGGDYEVAGDGTLSLVGGTWEEGEFDTNPSLPDGVDADDVQGLRFTFQRTDGSQWENPANPTQTIPLEVKRRAYQAIDGTTPVPSSADTNAPAPGEDGDAGGAFTNTVQAHVVGSVPSEGSVALTADDEYTAQVYYEAGGIEVTTRKTPVGSQKPGEVIPFQLIVTNSASADAGLEKSILDPVITDTLPLTEDGDPWLVFDPESTEAHYEYSYTQTATPSGANTRMPIDPADITVDEVTNDAGEVIAIRFSFPEGTVLMPNEVYTITVNMMFRPGITAGTEITNGFDITSAEPFESCNGVEGDVEACGATTTVYPTASGALRGQKFVKADDDELGVNDVTNPAAVCEPVLDDFYAGNCVPVTKPLGTETWRERVTNTGTLEMDKVVTIDRLPTPGDQGAYVALPRGSQWEPSWAGGIEPVTDDGYRVPETVEYYYSSAENPCTADLTPGISCAEGDWLPLTDDVDPTLIRHIKTVFGFADEHFLPGDVLGYTFQTRTPAVSPVATAGTVAWNTIAIGAQTVRADGTRIGDLLPTEGRRVGVALATGPLSIAKGVTGAGAAFAPDEFQVLVQCVVGAGTDLETVIPDVAATVVGGEVVELEQQLPWGAECTLADLPDANGETSSTPGDPVTIGRDGEPVTVLTLLNTYELSDLRVSKTVVGARDQDGVALDYGTFDFSAVCTFLGEEVVADGFESAPMEFTLDADESRTLTGLPSGAECVITEQDAEGAQVTSAIVNADGSTADGAAEASVQTGASATASVAFTNTFALGAFELAKEVDGDAADAVPAQTRYTFAVLCTSEGDTVYETTLTLTKADADAGTVIRIDTLPLGAECAVTETGTGGATTASITPDTTESAVAVGTADEPLRFTAVNSYESGSLAVVKELQGDGVALWGTREFEVQLACTIDGVAVTIPGGAERILSVESGLEAAYEQLPVGAECVLTESRTGGATAVAVVDADGEPVESVVIASGEPELLRVQNTFDIGAIAVTKQITGDDADAAADAVFTVLLACTIDVDGEQVSIEIPGGAERELSIAGGLVVRYEQLPADASCELIETETGGATSVSITPSGDSSAVGVVDVPAGEDVDILVVNTFDTESEADVDAAADADAGADPEAAADADADVDAGADADAGADVGADADAGADVEAAADADAGTEAEGAADAGVEAEAAADADAEGTAGDDGIGSADTGNADADVDAGEQLGATGSEVPMLWLIGGIGLLLAGGVLVLRLRRRTE